MRQLSMTPRAIKGRAYRERTRVIRLCKGCGAPLENPKQAQQYCTVACRRINYTWDSEHQDCITCGREKKYQSQSYGLLCLKLRAHNLSYDDFQNLLLSQHYRCPVCFKELSEEDQIDHDHRCCDNRKGSSCGNCVRGVLHAQCNQSLGRFQDDPETLRRAAEYIERFIRNV